MSDSNFTWCDVADAVKGTPFHTTLVSLSKTFKPTVSEQLSRAFSLVWKLYIKGYSLEAEKIVDFVGSHAFSGDYRLWVWIESSLLLHAWMLREQKNTEKFLLVIAKLKQPENFDFQDELKNTVNQRARQRRLSGSLLPPDFSEDTQHHNNRKKELHERELIFMHELFIYFLADEDIRRSLDIEGRVLKNWSRIKDLVGC